jgi:hypothetical protein
MPSFRDCLLLLVFFAAAALIGCGNKQTVKTAKENPKTSGRLPPMPGAAKKPK